MSKTKTQGPQSRPRIYRAPFMLGITGGLTFWLVGLLPLPQGESLFYASVGAAFAVALAAFMHFRGWKHAMDIHVNECESHQKGLNELLTVNKENAASITEAEYRMFQTLHQLGEAYESLGETHPGELTRMSELMHDLSSLVLARVGLRAAFARSKKDEK